MVTLCCHHVITTNSHQGSVELSDWLLRNRNKRDKNISSLQSWSEFKLGGHNDDDDDAFLLNMSLVSFS